MMPIITRASYYVDFAANFRLRRGVRGAAGACVAAPCRRRRHARRVVATMSARPLICYATRYVCREQRRAAQRCSVTMPRC